MSRLFTRIIMFPRRLEELLLPRHLPVVNWGFPRDPLPLLLPRLEKIPPPRHLPIVNWGCPLKPLPILLPLFLLPPPLLLPLRLLLSLLFPLLLSLLLPVRLGRQLVLCLALALHLALPVAPGPLGKTDGLIRVRPLAPKILHKWGNQVRLGQPARRPYGGVGEANGLLPPSHGNPNVNSWAGCRRPHSISGS